MFASRLEIPDKPAGLIIGAARLAPVRFQVALLAQGGSERGLEIPAKANTTVLFQIAKAACYRGAENQPGLSLGLRAPRMIRSLDLTPVLPRHELPGLLLNLFHGG